jgi:ubiquinone biosynthesis protein
VGTLDERARQSLVRALLAIARGDGDALVDAFLELGFAGPGADRQGLRDDLAALFRDQLDRPLGEISLAEVLRDAFAVIRRRHLVLPADLALLVKTIAMSEGMGAQLDPGFRFVDALGAFAAPGNT